MSLDVGRICIKNYGREKGKKCIVTDIIDRNYVLVTGPKTVTGVRRRRVNVVHITSLQEKIKIKKGASDKVIIGVLKKENKKEYMESG